MSAGDRREISGLAVASKLCDCGEPVTGRTMAARFCDKCRAEHIRNMRREYSASHRDRKKTGAKPQDRVVSCERCGLFFSGFISGRLPKYCKPCRAPAGAELRKLKYVAGVGPAGVCACGKQITGRRVDSKYCIDCLPLVPAKLTRDWYYRNLAEQRKKGREKSVRDKESRRISGAAWVKNNLQRIRYTTQRRRSRLRGSNSNGVSPGEWVEICETFCNACAYCLRSGMPLHREHVIPISLGGKDEYENVIPSCKSCNSSKGNRLLAPWYAQRFSL